MVKKTAKPSQLAKLAKIGKYVSIRRQYDKFIRNYTKIKNVIVKKGYREQDVDMFLLKSLNECLLMYLDHTGVLPANNYASMQYAFENRTIKN